MRLYLPAEAAFAVTERIVLSMPSGEGFRAVGTLVLGGVASRVDLTFERTDDLQLALLSALDASLDGEVTLEFEPAADAMTLAVGPLRDGASADEGLALVLSRLVDEVEHEHRDGQEWLSLRVRRAAA